MQRQLLVVMFALLSVTYTAVSIASNIPPVNLNLIPTAETVGKGGYSFSMGAFHHDLTKETKDPIHITDGFFDERHEVSLESDMWLIPSRMTYGISERLDLTFGGTYSAGDSDKIIMDYYETGDNSMNRAYSQVVLDGVLGMKYVIQQGFLGMPTLALGGEVQTGYTLDDELIDETPADSYRFLAAQMYMSASYDLGIINLHGGVGIFASSKTVESEDKVQLPIQGGVEIPFSSLSIPFSSFAVVVDVASPNAFSGVDVGSIISGGFRCDISPRTAINAGFSSPLGFMLRLTVGGKKTAI